MAHGVGIFGGNVTHVHFTVSIFPPEASQASMAPSVMVQAWAADGSVKSGQGDGHDRGQRSNPRRIQYFTHAFLPMLSDTINNRKRDTSP
jgi:hypothetical protein